LVQVLGFNSLKTKIKSVKSVISDPGYIIHLWTQYWGVQSLFTLYFFTSFKELWSRAGHLIWNQRLHCKRQTWRVNL